MSRYSLSPFCQTLRPTETSPRSAAGSQPDLLQNVSVASALPLALRPAEPLKMTSVIFLPRKLFGLWSPRIHLTASMTFDLPDPLGPTTAVTPGWNSNRVRSANDLKPASSRERSMTTFDGEAPA